MFAGLSDESVPLAALADRITALVKGARQPSFYLIFQYIPLFNPCGLCHRQV
ncbi:MAG: hypothetical protein P8Y63_16155 [Deltaproteobacteria bacterium]|jgi:hypothetical protein